MTPSREMPGFNLRKRMNWHLDESEETAILLPRISSDIPFCQLHSHPNKCKFPINDNFSIERNTWPSPYPQKRSRQKVSALNVFRFTGRYSMQAGKNTTFSLPVPTLLTRASAYAGTKADLCHASHLLSGIGSCCAQRDLSDSISDYTEESCSPITPAKMLSGKTGSMKPAFQQISG